MYKPDIKHNKNWQKNEVLIVGISEAEFWSVSETRVLAIGAGIWIKNTERGVKEISQKLSKIITRLKT